MEIEHLLNKYRKEINALAKWCAKQERTRTEALKFLEKKNVGTPEERNKIISWFEELGFLSKERFLALAYYDLWIIREWGPLKIKHYLLRRGLPEPEVEAFLKEKLPESKIRQKLASMIKQMLKTEPDKAKIYRKLVQKGFPEDMVLQELETIYQ